jgi:formylglycine-generating enzyme required for sulfatase activity
MRVGMGLLLFGFAFLLAASAKVSPRPAKTPAITASDQILIHGGTFTMGSDDPNEESARPRTQVTVSAFWMDRIEVTEKAYARCVSADHCPTNDIDSWFGRPESIHCNWRKPGRDSYPMNCVDWSQARTYCRAMGQRLPTEAEWEFAARGTDGRIYPWGNEAPDPTRARYRGKNEPFPPRAGSAPVETYGAGASPFGLLNMAGNVSEWVEDVLSPYPGGSVVNPKHEGLEGPHVHRGGGWGGPSSGLTSTRRGDGSWVGHRAPYIGFRCARDASPDDLPARGTRKPSQQ